MQIVYIWTEKYGCLTSLGFNFNPKHHFEFDLNSKILKYEKRNPIFSDVWNIEKKKESNIELSVIVGNNGAGKSTLLELILNGTSFDGEGVMIAAFLINEKIKIYSRYTNLEICSHEKVEIYDYKDLRESNDGIEFSELKTIYYAHTFDSRYYRQNIGRHSLDISTMGLIRTDKEKSTWYSKNIKNNEIQIFFYEDIFRQIRFISQFNTYKKYLPFVLPQNAIVELVSKEIGENKIWERLNYDIENKKYKKSHKNEISELENKIGEKLGDFYDKYKLKFDIPNKTLKEGKVYFKEYIYDSLLINIFLGLIPSTVGSNTVSQYKRMLEVVNRILEQVDSCSSKKQLVSRIIQQHSNKIGDEVVYQDFITIVDKNPIMDIINVEFIEFNGKFTVLTQGEGLRQFFNSYKKVSLDYGFFNFHWPLSTGENAILSMLARIFEVIDKIKMESNTGWSRKTDIIVIMDEVDAMLHPIWQQEYIKTLISFLKDIYSEGEIQVILATHSPIILSDIPRENIIYLYKNIDDVICTYEGKEKKQTFGANIYSIFNDSFFLAESKNGMIGSLAKAHLDKLREQLDELKGMLELLRIDSHEDRERIREKFDYCRGVITTLADPIIQSQFKGEYAYLEKKWKKIRNTKEVYIDKEVIEIQGKFKQLNMEQKDSFIKYIISQYEE